MRITELVTGKKTEHPLWFQMPYSLGIGIGMLVFFNHLFRKRFNEEPNPLEVELYMYEENVNAYVIADEMRKKNEPGEGTLPRSRTSGDSQKRATMVNSAARLFVALLGFAGGLGVGSALAALLIVLDFIPRLAQLAFAYRKSIWFETAVVSGAVFWSLADFLEWRLWLPKIVSMIIIGTFDGIFVGMLGAALTEVMNVLPIIAKRRQAQPLSRQLVYWPWCLAK